MKTTYPAFLAALQSVIEGIDANIGKVYETARIWKSEAEIKEDGGVINIQAATPTALETVDKHGEPVTRFWFINVEIEASPMSNLSSEYRHTITLMPFYAFKDENDQEDKLRTACAEILDALNDRTVENTTLNTGAGYLGYLLDRPTMDGGIEPATIGDGTIVGHTAKIVVTFHEEIDHV